LRFKTVAQKLEFDRIAAKEWQSKRCAIRYRFLVGKLHFKWASNGMTIQVKPQSQLDLYKEHSFWLLPAEPLNKQLHSIVQQLAKKYDAIDFDPHVTIFSGPFVDDQTNTIARAIARLFSHGKLIPVKCDYTCVYTKTLFIQFQDSEVVRRMSDAIRDRSARPVNYVLNPHMSLLYKTMAVAKQAEICRTLDVPKGIYFFDRLRVIETEIPVTRPEQIKRWRMVFECGLGRP
jgi:Cyclic phosphodiesterase-like protein